MGPPQDGGHFIEQYNNGSGLYPAAVLKTLYTQPGGPIELLERLRQHADLVKFVRVLGLNEDITPDQTGVILDSLFTGLGQKEVAVADSIRQIDTEFQTGQSTIEEAGRAMNILIPESGIVEAHQVTTIVQGETWDRELILDKFRTFYTEFGWDPARIKNILPNPYAEHSPNTYIQVIGKIITRTVRMADFPDEPEDPDITNLITSLWRYSPDTLFHSVMLATRGQKLAEIFEKQLPPEYKNLIPQALLVHDIGKLPTPIIFKADLLTKAEFEQIRQHPIFGAKILQMLGASQQAIYLTLIHHENWSGNGYPLGIKVSELDPDLALAQQIMRIMDSIDAMFEKRVYKGAMGWDEIKAQLRTDASVNGKYSPEILEQVLLHEDVFQ